MSEETTRTWSDKQVKELVKASFIEGFQAASPPVVTITQSSRHPSEVGKLADEAFISSRAFDSIAAYWGPGNPDHDAETGANLTITPDS